MAGGLATRCPACGTVFRVVLDQLRVSEGWVRCGRCSEVFNAADSLVDLDTGASHPLQFDPAPPAESPAGTGDSAFDSVAERDGSPVVGNDSAFPSTQAADDDLATLSAADDLSTLAADPDDAPAALAPAPRVERDGSGTIDVPSNDADGAAVDVVSPPAVADARPSFVRRADRAERWRRPRVRAALAAAAALAALLLAGQAVFAWRDGVAAQLPALRPALAAGCALLGCEIGAPRVIAAVSVESSGLVRVERSALYRLSVALRNRAGFEVAVPAVEVAVTDAQGKLLARRVLRPAEMGASQLALGAGRDLLLQATLQLATEPVTGYTVELFYP